MFNHIKDMLFALFNIQLIAALSYNIALNQQTNLLSGQTNYKDVSMSIPTHSNDGIVTFWEQLYSQVNWQNYLVVLITGQTQVIDFGSSKTVRTIYICNRDQVNLQLRLSQRDIGNKIFIGNDLLGGTSSSSNNTLCITLSGYGTANNVISQWISCPAIQGVPASVNDCLLSGSNWYLVQFKANFKFQIVILIPLLEIGVTPNSTLYSNNITIQIQNCFVSPCLAISNCSTIFNSSNNPESDCNGIIGNAVLFQNVVNPNLGISSIGVLTNCSCSMTSFLSSDITSSYYLNIASLITSGETYFTIYLNQSAINVALFNITTLTDSIGLVCGDSSSYLSYCGKKEFVIWDNKLNELHNLVGSTLFTLSGNTLKIATSQASNVGVYSFSIQVQLTNYPSLGYFPQKAVFTLEVVDSKSKYNVLLLTSTNLFINTSPINNTLPQSANDGCVTYYEGNYLSYLDVLQTPQQQQFNMGQTKTVQSVYIALRDQQAIQTNTNNPLVTKIIVGNDPSSSTTISNTLCNVISGSSFPRSQWISCTSAVTGQYLWIVPISGSKISFSEVLAYQYNFIQVNSTLSVTASINQTNIMLPFQQQNPLVAYDSITNSSVSGGFNNYCYLSNNESQPTIDIKLKAYANIYGLIYLPLLQNTTQASSSLYSNNISIQVYSNDGWVSCSMIVNSNYQPESDCLGISTNQIKIQRNCQSNNCQLGLCSLGILSDCDCTNTQFIQQMMDSKFYFNTNNFIISNITDFTVSLGDPYMTLNLINIQLFADSKSLVCGDGTGITFCGPRTISLWEIQNNIEVNITNSTLISIDLTLLQLSIGTQNSNDIGHHKFLLKVSLSNYGKTGFFPQKTSFTVDVKCKSFDIIPVQKQTTFYYTIGSGNQTFSVANYLTEPAFCLKKITAIKANLMTQTPDVPLFLEINLLSLEFNFNLTNTILTDSSATYLVNATFGTISNLESTFTIEFQSGDDLTPYLVSPLQMPQKIPLDQMSALLQWSYEFPQAKDPQQKPLNFNFICPTMTQVLNQTLKYDVLTLRFKNSSESNLKQIPKGVQKCQLQISNGVQKANFPISLIITYSVQQNISIVSYQVSNTSTQNMVAPVPKIESISNRGLVIVMWNVDMNQDTFSFLNVTFNQTVQNGRLLKNYNQKNPLLVLIQPGSTENDLSNLQINAYKIVYYEKNIFQIQLFFDNPGYVSAISKDFLKVIFNPEYFKSKNNVSINFNQSIILEKAPKQIAQGSIRINLAQTTVGLLNTVATCTVLSIPLFQFFANYILSIIDPLIVITHYILIDLNYPANLQDFFSQIFPLIQYDIFQFSQLNQIMFNLDQINDGALSENFNEVGYNNILAINNIGSLLILIVIQPISVAILFLIQKLLKSKTNSIAKLVKQFVSLKLQSLLWNGIIEFYFGSYLVLSIIGWISINDIRLGSQFTATENFSSLLGISLVIFSIVFPVILSVIYKKGYKPFQQNLGELLKQKNRTQIIDNFLNKHGSLENYYNKTQTYEDRMKFMQKYGGLFDELRTNRVGGINETIGFPLITLLSQMVVIFAVIGFLYIPVLSVFAFMYILVPQIYYLLQYKPYKEKLDHYRDLFNLTAKSFLTYMLILFTNYVDISISISGGSQFLVVVLLMIGVNIVVYPLKMVYFGSLYLRRFFKRCKMQRKKQNKDKIIQMKQIKQQRKQDILNKFLEMKANNMIQNDEEPNYQENRLPQQKFKNTQFQGDQNMNQEDKKQPKSIKVAQFVNLKQQPSNRKSYESYITQILPTKSQQSRYDSTLYLPNKISEVSDEFSSDQNSIQNRSNSSIYSNLEELKLDQSTQKLQELITSQIGQPINKNQTGSSAVKIGMTDVSRWQRHWNYAFEPTVQNDDVNRLEADSYIQYLKTRKVILQWDKPPNFTNLTLSQECKNAYNKRIQELNNQIQITSKINNQTEQLRNIVAQMLYDEPFIDDLESRKELSKEISAIQLEQFVKQISQQDKDYD